MTVTGLGMVPTFLSLLEGSDPVHLHLACFALQKLMNYGSWAVLLFKELGGVKLLRLQIEVHRVMGSNIVADNSMMICESSRCGDDQLFSRKRAIKVSLKALGSTTFVQPVVDAVIQKGIPSVFITTQLR